MVQKIPDIQFLPWLVFRDCGYSKIYATGKENRSLFSLMPFYFCPVDPWTLSALNISLPLLIGNYRSSVPFDISIFPLPGGCIREQAKCIN